MFSSCSTASSIDRFDLADLEEALSQLDEPLPSGDSLAAAGDRGGPPSFYHVQELNKEGVTATMPPRLSRVPSQYQLESLTEVYVFDIPQLTNNSLLAAAAAVATTPLDDSHAVEMNDADEMRTVYAPSEYISLV